MLRPRVGTCFLDDGGNAARSLLLAFGLASLVAHAKAGPAGLEKETIPSAVVSSPWSLSVTLLGGWDTNALQLPKAITSPGDPSRRGFGFFESSIELSYEKEFHWATLTAAYSLTQDIYDGAIDNNLADHVWMLSLGKTADESATWGWNLGLEDEYQRYDEEPFENEFRVLSAMTYRWTNGLASTVGYELHYNDFYFATSPVATLDSVQHVVFVDQDFALGEQYTLTLGYLHRWDLARGGDADRNRDQLSVKLKGSLSPVSESFLHSIKFSATFKHQWDDFLRAQSSTAFRTGRDDDNDTVNVGLEREMNSHWKIVAGYRYLRTDSNLPVRTYDEHIITAGVKLTFP